MKACLKTAAKAQRGVTLVELMVALVIGLVISLAAAALYLAAQESSRSMRAVGDINETGKIALDMVGREIQKSGFFPRQFSSVDQPGGGSADFFGGFFNGKAGNRDAFANGLFGCDGATYNPTTRACNNPPVPTAPDAIVVNYFSTPEFGPASPLGNFNDCNRQPVSNDADNAARAAAGRPQFVSNRYGLITSTYVGPDNNNVATHSLACHGNGADTAAEHQPMVQGVEDMVIRYGIYGAGAVQSPAEFLTAAQVTAKLPIDGRTAWQRVTAVKVCVLVRSLDAARQEDKAANQRTYRNCRGLDATPPAGDRFIYRRFERIFAVRNNLNASL